MTDNEFEARRRQLVKYLGGGALMASFASLTACSDDKSSPSQPPANAASSPDPASMSQRSTPPGPSATAPATGSMPKLEESDPQAMALAYVEDASRVDSAKQPRYEAGQLCSNCALYLPGDDAAWGGCSIFAGKLVSADGWCSVYAPKS